MIRIIKLINDLWLSKDNSSTSESQIKDKMRPKETVGFQSGLSTIYFTKSLDQVIQKYFNRLLYVGFKQYCKTFDTIINCSI